MDSKNSMAIVNADFRTMNMADPRAEAVLVLNGEIAKVGSDTEIRELAKEHRIDVADAGGLTVLPGFVDAHTHMELSSYSLSNWPQAHTPPCTSLAEVAQIIREYLAKRSGNDFVLVRSSFGMHTKVDERRLFSRAELDEIAPDRPVAVASGFHALSLNTAAMELLGIFDLSDSPERFIHRDADGEPTGVVTEVHDILPFFAEDRLEAALREQVPALATRLGVTTIGSITWDPYDPELLGRLIDEGMPLRLRSYVQAPRVMSTDEALALAVDSRASILHAGIGGLKIFIDGQHGDGLDAVFDDPKWTQAALNEFVAKASASGTQVIMHAVSTTAIRMAFDAIEHCGAGAGNPLRHRIEHGADNIEAGDIARAASLGVLLLVTPQFIQSSEGESSEPQALLRSILNAGVRLFGGTDTTGTVPEGAAPLFNIACAISRPVQEGWTLDERLDFDEAARLFTSSAAYALFEEDSRGEISEGKVGDLVVLNRAVDEICDPREYFDLRVTATVFDGRAVYDSLGVFDSRGWGAK